MWGGLLCLVAFTLHAAFGHLEPEVAKRNGQIAEVGLTANLCPLRLIDVDSVGVPHLDNSPVVVEAGQVESGAHDSRVAEGDDFAALFGDDSCGARDVLPPEEAHFIATDILRRDTDTRFAIDRKLLNHVHVKLAFIAERWATLPIYILNNMKDTKSQFF